ncbi:MarR family winged helix-turn-helix transcriptional regulator [Mycolicibacterium peregrinum]|uniref:MarR family transcriptional regulator n=1 Tax=Mycolicibacterium peregrinum TaxID=43304 RepID=A0A4Z0HVA0_MYCPR|nr:MarR family transcriptional regulator [Mycolicibacterium peregrinum]TGB45491.1 MarR family transcriptional regulator [Mycolicibacterium peregrinum]TGB47779.1 MarR family transcriptional regulator [Mycolicibacterium peregrinum]
MCAAKHPDPALRATIADAFTQIATLVVRHLGRGMNLTSTLVLSTLDDNGPARLTALATAAGISQPAMTQCIGKLEREGFVARFVDPADGRATLVAVTDAGRQQCTALTESLHARTDDLLDVLSIHDQETLGLAMRVVIPLIGELIDSAASADV